MTRAGKRWALGLGVTLLVALAALASMAWAERPRELPPLETELPEFDPLDPALARAPASDAFGLALGRVTLAEAEAELRARGLLCTDTGVRTSVAKLRERKREELEASDDPDAVSGASILWRRSNKERNPQIRLACELDSIADFGAGRPAVAGRALLVFDSPELPLRHASLRRTHTDPERALADLRESIARFTAIYGPPTLTRGVVPEPPAVPSKPEPVRARAAFAG